MRVLLSLAAAILLGVCWLLYFYPVYKNRRIIQDIAGIQLPTDARVVAHYSESGDLGMSGIRIFKLEAASLSYPATQVCADIGYRDLSADDINRMPQIVKFLAAERACISQSKGKLDGFSILQEKSLVVIAFY